MTVLRVSLIVILAALTVRFGLLVVEIGVGSVQQDFASYYVAGQSVTRGLSPFDNHIDADPPLWDGVAVFRHSRFMYPPVVAYAFTPLTLLPYLSAKFVWMILIFAALAASLWQAARLVDLRLDLTNGLILAVAVTAYFPVLTLLERGQIDSVTLMILIVAIRVLVRGKRQFPAGVLLAVATAVKLHGLFLLPFLIARKRWYAVLGFLAGAMGILMLSLLAHGPGPLNRYILEELPRISRYGDAGPAQSRLEPYHFRSLMRDVSPGHTTMQGRTYEIESFPFEINASAVRTPVGRAVWKAARALGVPIAPSHVSLVFLVAGMVVLFAWQRWAGAPRDRPGELAYWNSVLIVILLCAPMTWSMGTVWLLPTVVVALEVLQGKRRRDEILPVLLCVTGLVTAGLPDSALHAFSSLAKLKYIVAELLCLAGLLGIWRARGGR